MVSTAYRTATDCSSSTPCWEEPVISGQEWTSIRESLTPLIPLPPEPVRLVIELREIRLPSASTPCWPLPTTFSHRIRETYEPSLAVTAFRPCPVICWIATSSATTFSSTSTASLALDWKVTTSEQKIRALSFALKAEAP